MKTATGTVTVRTEQEPTKQSDTSVYNARKPAKAVEKE